MVTVITLKNPPELDTASRLVYQVTVEPRPGRVLKDVQVTVTLDAAMKKWAPSYWLVFRGEKCDLDPNGIPKGQKLGFGRYIPKLASMTALERKQLDDALSAPVTVEVACNTGHEVITIPSSGITHHEYESKIPPS